MHYQQLISEVWSMHDALEESVISTKLNELELQALWYAGMFGREFFTVKNQAVTIVQFGEWNRGSGPDFQHVVVKIDGVEFAGDLELDPRAEDWEAHGHAENDAFCHTVLHVCFSENQKEFFTRTSEHKLVPRIVIPPDLLEQALFLPKRDIAFAKAGRCVAPLKNMDDENITQLLREASLYRAKIKYERFAKTASAHGEEQALFSAVAHALGYRGNTLPMEILAQRCNIQALKKNADQVEAILLGSAGFLYPEIHEQADDKTRDYLRNLWDTWWHVRQEYESTRPLPWKLHGSRPANHPHRRVAALALLLPSWKTFYRLVFEQAYASDAIVNLLENIKHDYWNHRHTLKAAESKNEIAIIGRQQALEFIANYVMPIYLHRGMPYEAYQNIKTPARNEKIRRVAIRLFGDETLAAPWLKTLAHQQALLQIYQDFCLEDTSDCSQCPFPEQLAQWTRAVGN